MKAKPVSAGALALCCLAFAGICLFHAGPVSGKIKMAPCLEVRKKAQDTKGEENVKLIKAADRARNTMEKKEYDEWYACEQVKVYKAIVKTINANKHMCTSDCIKNKKQGCDREMQDLIDGYGGEYKYYINLCPTENSNPNSNQNSTTEPSPGSSPKPPGRNTMTFHD